MRDGTTIKIKDMDENHLKNTIRMLKNALIRLNKEHFLMLECSDYHEMKDKDIEMHIGIVERKIEQMENELLSR